MCLILIAALSAEQMSSALTAQETKQETESSAMPVALPELGARLSAEQVSAFAKLALANIHTEYPNKPGNVVWDEASVRTPRAMHPAFYGCFDWHSSVHGHWMLIRLLKDYSDHPMQAEIRQKLAQNLTAENLKKEADHFREKHNRMFERMYGWWWLLRLAAELETWDDPQGQEWRESIRPLEELLVENIFAYLPNLTWPIRTGVHQDLAFALGQELDYARVMKNGKLAELIQQRAKEYYVGDTDYPTKYEPSGQDFFSSCLNEADLMRRVLTQAEFVDWLDAYLPGLKRGEGGNLLTPVTVSDVTDGYIVHLAGLNLSRAWCMKGIAAALPDGDARKNLLHASAAAHAKKGFGYVFSGHYEGDHWLATFAIYLQAGVGVNENRR
jgi:hypothetical protein